MTTRFDAPHGLATRIASIVRLLGTGPRAHAPAVTLLRALDDRGGDDWCYASIWLAPGSVRMTRRGRTETAALLSLFAAVCNMNAASRREP